MKAFIEEYGLVIFVIAVIVALVAIVGVVSPVISDNFEKQVNEMGTLEATTEAPTPDAG